MVDEVTVESEDLFRTKLGFALTVLLLALIVVFSFSPPTDLTEHAKLGSAVIRIDDIQDYYFHDTQIQLLLHSVNRGYPLSLGIIAKDFGLDAGLVEAVRAAIRTGSEVAAHGWTHDDLTQLTASEQKVEFLRAKNRLWNTLAVDTSVLIPPMYSYSNGTLLAMKQAGYEIVSGYIGLNDGGLLSEGIVSAPATVELSEQNGDNWKMKSIDDVMTAFNVSIASNGYAVVVTHPEEFVHNGTFDEDVFGRYCEILDTISFRLGLTTLEGLKPRVLLSNSTTSNSEWLGLATSAILCRKIRISHRAI